MISKHQFLINSLTRSSSALIWELEQRCSDYDPYYNVYNTPFYDNAWVLEQTPRTDVIKLYVSDITGETRLSVNPASSLNLESDFDSCRHEDFYIYSGVEKSINHI